MIVDFLLIVAVATLAGAFAGVVVTLMVGKR